MVQAMLLSLLYLFLLKCLAGPLIWISAFGSIALLSFGTSSHSLNKCMLIVDFTVVFGSLKKYEVAETPDEFKNFRFMDIFNSQTYELLINSKPFWLGITILAAILLVTVFVLIVFLRTRVQLATAIIGCVIFTRYLFCRNNWIPFAARQARQCTRQRLHWFSQLLFGFSNYWHSSFLLPSQYTCTRLQSIFTKWKVWTAPLATVHQMEISTRCVNN